MNFSQLLNSNVNRLFSRICIRIISSIHGFREKILVKLPEIFTLSNKLAKLQQQYTTRAWGLGQSPGKGVGGRSPSHRKPPGVIQHIAVNTDINSRLYLLLLVYLVNLHFLANCSRNQIEIWYSCTKKLLPSRFSLHLKLKYRDNSLKCNFSVLTHIHFPEHMHPPTWLMKLGKANQIVAYHALMAYHALIWPLHPPS